MATAKRVIEDYLVSFVDALEEKVLARDPGAEVYLKSVTHRPGVYMVLIESRRGEQEAYEIAYKADGGWDWIKVYG